MEDTDIFETKVVRDLIHYHWDNYALHVHSFGALMHMLYVINFFVYVAFVYQERDFRYRSNLIIVMFVTLLYPLCFEGM